MATQKTTISLIKADIGGYVGHSSSHPDILAAAGKKMAEAQEKRLLVDYRVMHCGDDLELLMTHHNGPDAERIHQLAWDTFMACTHMAQKMKLYGAGQDILSDAFSGNVKGMGPGVAEMEFVERKSDPVIVFMADKTSPGAWNIPLFHIFADPFNTPGLVIDPAMHTGFEFDVLDAQEGKSIRLACPEELYDLLMFLGAPGRFMIRAIYRKKDGEIAAVASTQKLSLIAGKYVGKDDPVLIVRSQSGLPAVGEVLEPFAFPHLVSGWMRGSHNGPLMPVSFATATPTRFDGPPRVIAAGFQVADGNLIGPTDLFADPSFDRARQKANEIADYMRRHGPFEPHRLPLEDMEYTTMPLLMKQLEKRWEEVK